MKNPLLLKGILVLAGLVAIAVGLLLLFAPTWLYAQSGIDLVGKTSLLNETRAPGGAILASGVLITAGAFAPKLSFSAALLATLLYLGYGLARIVSMIVDGMPAPTLVQVCGFELLFGVGCLFVLLQHRDLAAPIDALAPGA